MKFKTTMLLPLILCAGWTTAADANYFHNPKMNINFSIGAAPSPKPQDVRENRQPQVSEMSFPTAQVKVTAEEVLYFQIVDTSGPKTVASNSASD